MIFLARNLHEGSDWFPPSVALYLYKGFPSFQKKKNLAILSRASSDQGATLATEASKNGTLQ